MIAFGLVLVVVVSALIYVSREYFENQESISPENASAIAASAPDAIPPIDPVQIAIVKKGIVNVIEKRPDVVNALQDVFADPAINPTVQKIFNPSAMPSTTTQSLQSYLTQAPAYQVPACQAPTPPAPSCTMDCSHEESCE
jgi:hypothetical protein